MGHYSLIGKGIYSLTDAYRITKIPRRRIARWTRGYRFSYGGNRRWSEPLVAREAYKHTDSTFLTFLDLIEVRFLEVFRTHGVSMRSIRIAASRAREILNTTHPFSTKQFKTEGRSIFAEFVDDLGDQVLVDLVKNQYAFKRIISPYLYGGIEFNEGNEPMRWWPLGKRGGIVIDPYRGFGAPLVDRVGIPTQLLHGQFKALDSVRAVADWYGIGTSDVEHAIAYEESLPH